MLFRSAGASVCIDRRNGFWSIYKIPDDETGLPDSPKCAYNRTTIFSKVLSRPMFQQTFTGAVCDCEDPSDAVYAVISGLGSLRCVTPLIHFFQREPQRVGAAPGTKCSYLDDYPNKETIRAPGGFQCYLPDELLLTLPIYLNGQVI